MQLVTHTATPELSSSEGAPQRLTRVDTALGSPPYMSPEQWSDPVTVGPSADLYALGVVAYEALTGSRPFEAATVTGYVELHRHATVPPLGVGFPPALDRLFRRALAKQPEERFASALELAAAFRAASGLGDVAADLPRLDEAVSEAWLAHAPQPLAESVAAVDGARSAHQARDAAQELVRSLVRYLIAIAFAARSQVREDGNEPELVELVRTMRQRELGDDERVRLLRLLVRPLAHRRGAHPVPELVDLVTPDADDGADGLDGVLALLAAIDHAGSDEAMRSRVARLLPELADVLQRVAFILDYALVVPRDQAAERWTGLRRQHRAVATVRANDPVDERPVLFDEDPMSLDDHPMLLDRDGRIRVDLWPLVQAQSPSEGAEPELFVLEGRGRHGALLMAAPTGFERCDPAVWDWVAAHVIPEVEATSDAGPDDDAPYVGLMSFSTGDAGRFVGREREVDALLNRLRQRPLQIVVGASGAGKSSFVHAGVLAGLPPTWRAITLRPGASPLATLASRLTAANISADALPQSTSTASLKLSADPAEPSTTSAHSTSAADSATPSTTTAYPAQSPDSAESRMKNAQSAWSPESVALSTTAGHLQALLEASPAAVAALVAHAAAGGTIVIVVDQLEELFTLCASSDERLRFAAAIAQLAASVDAPIRVICTIRDDFLMQLEALTPLRPLLSPALVLLGNPSRDTLVRILVEPARRAGYTLSDSELAHDIVSAVPDRPGALALLSFTASRLWELRDRRFRQLTRGAYEAMGGVGGALGRHAETTFEALASPERRSARDIFRHLVTVDGTRAVLTSRELRERLAAPRADAVIDKLVAARLIAVSDSEGEPTVEIIHEALIAAWPRLQQWMREDADGARMREQVRAAARSWHDRGRPRGLLWRDELFTDVERWLRRSGPGALGDLETVFVEACRRRVKWKRRWLLGLAAAGLLIAFGGFQYRALRARLAQRIAETHVTQSYVEQGRHALLDGKHAEALIHLSEAHRRGDLSPGVEFMLARAAQPFFAIRARLPAASGNMWSATFSPDDRRIATTDDQGVRLWDARTYDLVAAVQHDAKVYDASFSPDSTLLVAVGMTGFVQARKSTSGELVHELTAGGLDRPNQSNYLQTAVSPDGTLIAAVELTGGVARVWESTSGALIAELPKPGGEFGSLAFSSDSRWLGTSGGDNVLVFDTRTWKSVVQIASRQTTSLAFDPTGPRLAIASGLGDAAVWALPEAARIHHLQMTGAWVNHVAYSPDGSFVATASQDGSERVWDARTGALQLELRNHRGNVPWVGFDPTSRRVASAGADRAVVISDVAIAVPVAVLEGPRGRVNDARFDPSSRLVVGSSWDGFAWVWDATAPYHRWSSRPIDDDCINISSLAGDRRFLAVRCTHRGTHVWDTANDQLLADLPSVTTPAENFDYAFPAVSAVSGRAAIAIGNTVAVYTLPDGRLIRTITHPAAVTAVAFAKSGHDLITGGADGSLLFTADGRDSLMLPGFPGGVDAVGITADGRAIVAGRRRHIRVIDLEHNRPLAELESPIRIRSFRLSADGLRMITLPQNGVEATAVLWDLERYRIIAKLEGKIGHVFSAHFVHGDRDILTATNDGSPRLWDGMTGRLRQRYVGNDQYLSDAVLDPAGSTIVAGGGDGVLRFWDVVSGRMIWTMRAHRSGIAGIHYEGSDIVTRGFTGEVSRWEISRQLSPELLRSVDDITRCLPLRLDENTGSLIEQQACDTP
jgi:WD40 repeat protein